MVVPTYNYVAVHVTGRLIVHDDARAVRRLVARLTRHFEMDREVPGKWQMRRPHSSRIG
jgi:transcriptional regulator